MFQARWHVLFAGVALSGVPLFNNVIPSGQPIRLPDPRPTPPLPPPVVTDAITLQKGVIYPVECDIPCLLLASPNGRVVIQEQPGPVTVYGAFVGGTGGYEWRTMKAKQVFLVTGAVSGDVELLVVPLGTETQSKDVVRRTIRVEMGQGPIPPPIDPKVDPKPIDPKPVDPQPNLPAAPDDVTRVLVVFNPDTLTNQTEKRKAILYGGASHEYMNKVTPLGPDGKTHEWRVYPFDAKFATQGTAWEKLLARPRKDAAGNVSNWWVVVTKGGKIVLEAELPPDTDAFIALLKPVLGGP